MLHFWTPHGLRKMPCMVQSLLSELDFKDLGLSLQEEIRIMPDSNSKNADIICECSPRVISAIDHTKNDYSMYNVH